MRERPGRARLPHQAWEWGQGDQGLDPALWLMATAQMSLGKEEGGRQEAWNSLGEAWECTSWPRDFLWPGSGGQARGQAPGRPWQEPSGQEGARAGAAQASGLWKPQQGGAPDVLTWVGPGSGPRNMAAERVQERPSENRSSEPSSPHRIQTSQRGPLRPWLTLSPSPQAAASCLVAETA